MIKQKVKITNRHGLHTRPATVLVTKAAQFHSEVFLTYNGIRINAKSILGVLVLAVEPGSEVILEVNGDDETAAMQELLDLINHKFYTEE